MGTPWAHRELSYSACDHRLGGAGVEWVWVGGVAGWLEPRTETDAPAEVHVLENTFYTIITKLRPWSPASRAHPAVGSAAAR